MSTEIKYEFLAYNIIIFFCTFKSKVVSFFLGKKAHNLFLSLVHMHV